MANFLYVDNSNVWIEGMHVAAVVNGLAPSIKFALDNKICDYSYKVDFGKLLGFAGGDRAGVGKAVLYGSRPPKNDSLWKAAESKGFEVVVHDRSVWSGKEKKIDTNIVTDITSDSYELMKPDRDEITLVAGDSDYVPMIEKLRSKGFRFDVCFWGHASGELKRTCSNFIELNPYFQHLRLI